MISKASAMVKMNGSVNLTTYQNLLVDIVEASLSHKNLCV